MNSHKRSYNRHTTAAKWFCGFYLWAYCLSEIFRIETPIIPVNLQQLSLVLVFVIALYYGIKPSLLGYYFNNRSVITVSIYVIAAFISSVMFYTKGIVFGLSLTVNYLFMFGVYVLSIEADMKKVLIVIHNNIRILVWIQLFLGILQYTVPEQLPNALQPTAYGILAWSRINGFFRDPNYFAFFLAIALVMNVVFKKNKGMFIRAENIAIFGGIMISGSLTSALALIFAYASYIIITTHRKSYYFKGILSLSIFVVILLFAPYSKSTKTYFRHKNDQISNITDPKYNPRAFHLLLGWQMFKDKPLFGHGYGSFQHLSFRYFPSWSITRFRDLGDLDAVERGGGIMSHVLVATVMAEMGIIGLILVVLLFYWTITTNFRAYNTRRDQVGLFFTLIWVMFFIKSLSYGFRLSDGLFMMFLGQTIVYHYKMVK